MVYNYLQKSEELFKEANKLADAYEAAGIDGGLKLGERLYFSDFNSLHIGEKRYDVDIRRIAKEDGQWKVILEGDLTDRREFIALPDTKHVVVIAGLVMVGDVSYLSFRNGEFMMDIVEDTKYSFKFGEDEEEYGLCIKDNELIDIDGDNTGLKVSRIMRIDGGYNVEFDGRVYNLGLFLSFANKDFTVYIDDNNFDGVFNSLEIGMVRENRDGFCLPEYYIEGIITDKQKRKEEENNG